MSKIQQVEQVVMTMTPEEQEELHDWLENLLEDRLEMTEEFKAEIAASLAEHNGVFTSGSTLHENAALIADTWNKLGPAPEIDYDKLQSL